MRITRLGAALLLVGLVGSEARGQAAGLCGDIYASPRVGDFAEAEVSGMGDFTGMRMAVVGTERAGGRQHHWIEIRTAGPATESGGDALIAQILVPGYPFDAGQIEGYIVQLPGRPPMKLTDEMIDDMGRGQTDYLRWQEECEQAEDLGIERIAVEAGTFRARHLRTAGPERGDIWLADVPFGMVKYAQGDSLTMELTRYGTGATSSITDDPIEYRPPPDDGVN